MRHRKSCEVAFEPFLLPVSEYKNMEKKELRQKNRTFSVFLNKIINTEQNIEKYAKIIITKSLDGKQR